MERVVIAVQDRTRERGNDETSWPYVRSPLLSLSGVDGQNIQKTFTLVQTEETLFRSRPMMMERTDVLRMVKWKLLGRAETDA